MQTPRPSFSRRASVVIKLTALLSLLGLACSSSTTGPTEAPPVQRGDGDADADPSAPDDAAVATPDASKRAACAVEDDANTSDFAKVAKCVRCCDTAHPDPSFDEALHVCACSLDPKRSPGRCVTDCKTTACSPTAKPPSGSCTQCLQNAVVPGGDCVDWLATECEEKPSDCAAHLACLSACKL